MATLAALRAKLNGEVGVTTDADTVPWSSAVRDNAIRDGYAWLWRVGVWKPLTEPYASVSGQFIYALTAIRKLERVELVDTNSVVQEIPRAIVQPNGSGGYELRLIDPLAAGYTIRVRGFGAYKSQFANDADTDDLPAEDNRIPLLKAKAILYRIAVGKFTRTGERQTLPPEMNVSVDNLLAVVAAAEREAAEEARALSRLRIRTGQVKRL